MLGCLTGAKGQRKIQSPPHRQQTQQAVTLACTKVQSQTLGEDALWGVLPNWFGDACAKQKACPACTPAPAQQTAAAFAVMKEVCPKNAGGTTIGRVL